MHCRSAAFSAELKRRNETVKKKQSLTGDLFLSSIPVFMLTALPNLLTAYKDEACGIRLKARRVKQETEVRSVK